MDSFFSHCIAPEIVFRGGDAWEKALQLIPSISTRPLFLGRSRSTLHLRNRLLNDLKQSGLKPFSAELKYDCCDSDLDSLKLFASRYSCNGVIAAGGGKVLDAGKLLAHYLKIPCITVPLSASTCAGWTALANIYSPDGAYIRDEILERCPTLLVFDHGLVRQAPIRTLSSGIADGLAKWYEASVSSAHSKDALVQQAVQMSRVLRDQLLIDSNKALEYLLSEEWILVAECCALSAGLIGGIGGACCRTVAAHAVHNGLTQLEATHENLHGEKVGFGILVQLKLEEMIGDN